jgi:hypothetical protein
MQSETAHLESGPPFQPQHFPMLINCLLIGSGILQIYPLKQAMRNVAF